MPTTAPQTVFRSSVRPCRNSESDRRSPNSALIPVLADELALKCDVMKAGIFIPDGTVVFGGLRSAFGHWSLVRFMTEG